MKDLKKILPFALLAIAGVVVFYFVWYKPKKDKEDAAAAAAQAEYDKQLTFNPLDRFKVPTRLQDQRAVQAAIAIL